MPAEGDIAVTMWRSISMQQQRVQSGYETLFVCLLLFVFAHLLVGLAFTCRRYFYLNRITGDTGAYLVRGHNGGKPHLCVDSSNSSSGLSADPKRGTKASLLASHPLSRTKKTAATSMKQPLPSSALQHLNTASIRGYEVLLIAHGLLSGTRGRPPYWHERLGRGGCLHADAISMSGARDGVEQHGGQLLV